MIESGVLKGLNLEDIKKAGERMILQDGCTSFFMKLIKNEIVDVNVHVLSYCWCGDLIRSAFCSGKLFSFWGLPIFCIILSTCMYTKIHRKHLGVLLLSFDCSSHLQSVHLRT